MAYFEDKTISKEKTSALLLNTHLEHDTCNKHIMQEKQDILQVFVYYYVFFQAAPGFLSRREVNSWPGVEPWREIFEWGAIFSQHPLPGLVGISNSNSKRKKLTKMLCFRYQHLVFTLHREVTLCLRDTFGNIFYTSRCRESFVNIICQTTASYMLPERFGYNMLYSCVHFVTIGMLLSFIFIRTCFGSKLAFFT